MGHGVEFFYHHFSSFLVPTLHLAVPCATSPSLFALSFIAEVSLLLCPADTELTPTLVPIHFLLFYECLLWKLFIIQLPRPQFTV